MASNNIPLDSNLDNYEMCKKEINETFDACIEELNIRRCYLLEQISDIYSEYELRETARIKTIAEIERIKDDFENHLYENAIAQLRSSTLEILQKQKYELERENIFFNVLFKHQSIESFYTFVDNSFSIETCTPETNNFTRNEIIPGQNNMPETTIPIEYTSKIEAVATIGETGTGASKFDGPMKIFFDKEDKLYVPDGKNGRMQILSTDGAFINEFGKDHFKFPCSVAVEDSSCYVADSAGQAIFKFSLPNYELMKKENKTPKSSKIELSFPVDIKVDPMSDWVFVADLENDRICIFDSNLGFQRDFGHEGNLKKPQFIQFWNDKIYVLDRGDETCLHQFSRSNVREKSFLTRGIGKDIASGKSFCFDRKGNVIIADFEADTVKVFAFVEEDEKLEVIHKIGAEAPNSEVVGGCMGVVLVEDKLVVSCQSPDSCLKVF